MEEFGLDIYKEVWCVMRYGNTEFDRVYTNKEEAEKVAEENNKTAGKTECPKYMVKSLADGIDWVREAIEDNRRADEYYNET